MKLYGKKELIPITLILALLILGIYFYPQLPEQVPTHWNIQNQVDGWSSKNFAVFFFPALIAALYLLLSLLPLMDPLRVNIEDFAHWYFGLKVVFILFLALLYVATIYAGLGYEMNIGRIVVLGIAGLFFYIGITLHKIKKNYTIGIRLPWTLHSEAVWNKTHRFGGRLFVGLSFVLVFASLLPGSYAFWTLIVGLILLLAILIWYSYNQYRHLPVRPSFR